MFLFNGIFDFLAVEPIKTKKNKNKNFKYFTFFKNISMVEKIIQS